MGGAFAYGGTTVDRTRLIRVVGVVEDVRYKTLAEEAEPTYYVPQAQTFASTHYAVVVTVRDGPPEGLIPFVREELTRFER